MGTTSFRFLLLAVLTATKAFRIHGFVFKTTDVRRVFERTNVACFSLPDDEKAFVDYMFRELGCQGEPGDIQVRRCDETGRRGVYLTSDTICEGDYVFAIPKEAAFVVDQGMEDEELSDASKGLLLHKWQQEQQPEDNNNKPYKDILPTRQTAVLFDPTPDFWSYEQISALELPPTVQAAVNKKESVQALAAKTGRDVISEDDLRFATWLVSSRAVTVVDNGDEENENDDDDDCEESIIGTTCVMVPLLDMINHSSDEPNAYFAVLGDDDDDESLYYAVVADRDLNEGEELLISYGSEEDSSMDLLLQYGFCPDTNPYDVDFWESFCEESGDNIEFWTTSLKEDEDALSELSGHDDDKESTTTRIEKSILEFRIRMKRSYAEWKSLSE